MVFNCKILQELQDDCLAWTGSTQLTPSWLLCKLTFSGEWFYKAQHLPNEAVRLVKEKDHWLWLQVNHNLCPYWISSVVSLCQMLSISFNLRPGFHPKIMLYVQQLQIIRINLKFLSQTSTSLFFFFWKFPYKNCIISINWLIWLLEKVKFIENVPFAIQLQLFYVINILMKTVF